MDRPVTCAGLSDEAHGRPGALDLVSSRLLANIPAPHVTGYSALVGNCRGDKYRPGIPTSGYPTLLRGCLMISAKVTGYGLMKR